MKSQPKIFIFGGLPGVGKSTLAHALAQKIGAVYVRVDTIEQAIRDGRYQFVKQVGPEGYCVGYRVAEENLNIGMSVVADSVNPLEVTRKGWLKAAIPSKSKAFQIEVYCSDKVEHQRRVDQRPITVKNLIPPTWDEVCDREFEFWRDTDLRIDTANRSLQESLNEILSAVKH